MKDPNQVEIRLPSGRLKVATINSEPSMTQQQYKDECDINNIMKRYSTTGEFTHLTSKQGRFADFSQITDYQEMLHTIKYADEAFASLPADVRQRFSNNPSELLQFVQNPNNYDEGVKLGLVHPKLTNEPNPKPNDTKPPALPA